MSAHSHDTTNIGPPVILVNYVDYLNELIFSYHVHDPNTINIVNWRDSHVAVGQSKSSLLPHYILISLMEFLANTLLTETLLKELVIKMHYFRSNLPKIPLRRLKCSAVIRMTYFD